jgi:hypothetical protein
VINHLIWLVINGSPRLTCRKIYRTTLKHSSKNIFSLPDWYAEWFSEREIVPDWRSCRRSQCPSWWPPPTWSTLRRWEQSGNTKNVATGPTPSNVEIPLKQFYYRFFILNVYFSHKEISLSLRTIKECRKRRNTIKCGDPTETIMQ